MKYVDADHGPEDRLDTTVQDLLSRNVLTPKQIADNFRKNPGTYASHAQSTTEAVLAKADELDPPQKAEA